MGHFLKKAFDDARLFLQKTEHAYDSLGFLATRALVDNDFLAVDAARLNAGPLRSLADHYAKGRGKIQEKILEKLHLISSSGNVGPKPSLRPILFKGLTVAAEFMPRLTSTGTGVAAIALTGLAVTLFTMDQSGLGNGLPDLMAAWMGSAPHSGLAKDARLEPTPCAQPSIS